MSLNGFNTQIPPPRRTCISGAVGGIDFPYWTGLTRFTPSDQLHRPSLPFTNNESWFLADAVNLIGNNTPQAGRRKNQVESPNGNLEDIPRDAKGWVSDNMPEGYKPTIHQADFAKKLNIQTVRSRNLRSFRRFEHAVTDLFQAIISGQHVATP